MKKRNAGVTIVELVVVMAILAIATGITLANVGSLTGYRARECAKKISSELSSNKVTTLGKASNNGDITFEITKEGNKVYFTTHMKKGSSTWDEKKLMGKGRMIVEFVDSGTTKEIVPAGETGTNKVNKLALYYNRSTGQICKVNDDGTVQTEKCSISNIKISNSGRTKTYDIKVYPLTGKIKATW